MTNLPFEILGISDRVNNLKTNYMNNLFKGLLAGYGAKKLGGGCFSTVLVFILIWVLLGQCT
ncbi:hypothetical protein [Flavobacterium algicola]|uniref:hypothetical protein n=1 Tax=Flavobacterium algicola TaxID=556529 RepID=UPI001EFE74D3|nr:hypothetical protein [Flavobacterium algicola]MCG9793005.1 hypothetical protein [Flavobacterium algicola]